MQINNLHFPEYHTNNGETSFQFYFDIYQKKIEEQNYSYTKIRTIPIVTHSESAVAKINLLNNMYLKDQIGDDSIGIYSIISPIADIEYFRSFLRSVIMIASMIVIPLSMSLGVPFILYNIVYEKDHKIRHLLQINGLKIKNYWLSTFVYNFCTLSLVSLFYLSFAYFFVDIDFYKKTSLVCIFYVFGVWNLNQISFSIFLSMFIEKEITAKLIGFNFSIFIVVFYVLVCQFLYPSPNPLPIIFHIFPQGSFVRFIYLCFSGCSNGKCLEKYYEVLNGEYLTCFRMLHIQLIGYLCIGLAFGEIKFSAWVSYFRFSKPKTVLQDFIPIEIETDDQRSKNIQEESDYILVVEDVDFTYPSNRKKSKKSLDEFSIQIKKGEIFGLLGPNGAGKTTFLSILQAQIVQDVGQVRIEGKTLD